MRWPKPVQDHLVAGTVYSEVQTTSHFKMIKREIYGFDGKLSLPVPIFDPFAMSKSLGKHLSSSVP